MTLPLVSSVILNTNRQKDTMECLTSLDKSTYFNHKVIVLDNHSTDGSVEAIRSKFPSVQVVKLEENLGYAGNNNVGIEYALEQGADWVFVLNEDTILDEECLTNLVSVGESDKRIGVLGPMVYHHDEPEVIQTAGGKFGPRWEAYHLSVDERDVGQYEEPHLVDWISGCGIMVRREVIEQVGLIDERYFYFWEETEWCLRAGRSGWKIVHVPQAKMWHKGVQFNHQPKPSVTYYATRNRLLTLSKHHAPITAWVFAWGQLLRILTSWTLRPKWKGKREHRDAMWRGMVDFFFHRWGQAARY
jgi:GT2 family glycosyltransferase